MKAAGAIRIRKNDKRIFNMIGYTLVFLFGFICIFPFYLVVIASFTSEASLMKHGFSLYITDFSLDAYRFSFNNPQRIFWAYRNTICVTIIGTVLSTLMATMTGYVLQRKDMPGRNGLSFFFFFTVLFNGGLVPTYIINTRYFGFKNQYYALILPLMFSVWNMIIAKSYMKGLPYEITESAKVDGANDLVIFFKLILPLCKPLIATLGLFSALTYWNDWYNSLLYITDDSRVTLQYFLHEMLSSIESLKMIASRGGAVSLSNVTLPQETMKMAMTIIVTGPIIFLYPFVQKYFVKGLTLGAVKG
jgi:putative aldouronate transport system permease protein